MSETVTANDCQPPADIARPRSVALGVAAVATLLAGVGGFMNPDQFFKSYLLGYLLMLGIACGCLGHCLLHHMSRGAWGLMLRRVWEAAIKTLPIVALLFIPILLGREHIYSWMKPGAMDDPLLKVKEAYLNVPFFIARAAFYFAVWIGIGFGLINLSKKQDETADPRLFRRMQMIAGPGIVLFCLTITFAAFDWVMGLDPKWFSSIFGLIMLVGQGLSALAFCTLVIVFLGNREPMSRYLKPSNLHDYGKLTLAFTMVWAYFSFSQLIIIWSGNLPLEVTFLFHRVGPWKPVTIAAGAGELLPALRPPALARRQAQRQTLARVAVLVLAARWLDLYWYIAPNTHQLRPAALARHRPPGGAGRGLDLDVLRFPVKRPLLPFNDPFLTEGAHP